MNLHVNIVQKKKWGAKWEKLTCGMNNNTTLNLISAKKKSNFYTHFVSEIQRKNKRTAKWYYKKKTFFLP